MASATAGAAWPAGRAAGRSWTWRTRSWWWPGCRRCRWRTWSSGWQGTPAPSRHPTRRGPAGSRAAAAEAAEAHVLGRAEEYVARVGREDVEQADDQAGRNDGDLDGAPGVAGLLGQRSGGLEADERQDRVED